jgi:hypothetical protein
MAYPANASISSIVATTIENRSGKVADNLTQNNALLYRLRERGNVKPFGGGTVILQELMYNDPNTSNASSYSGAEIINISPNSPISAAQYNIKQYASAVTITGLEELQNDGPQRIIDMLATRIEVAEASLMNLVSTDLYGDGTGNNGKAIDGLAAAISTTPQTGVYGGIDGAAQTWWRNKVQSGGTPTALTIQQQLTNLAIQQRRNADGPDLMLADNAFFSLYVQSLQAIQRVNDNDGSGMAGAGFSALKFYGGGTMCDFVLANGAFNQSPANRVWSLNTNYLFFRPHTKRNFVPIGGTRESVNQDASVKIIGFAGNLCTNVRFLQGVLTN